MQHVSAAAPVIFGADPFWVAIGVFALTYLFVIADRINRSIIALLGAGIMVITGILSQDEAIRGIPGSSWRCCRSSPRFCRRCSTT